MFAFELIHAIQTFLDLSVLEFCLLFKLSISLPLAFSDAHSFLFSNFVPLLRPYQLVKLFLLLLNLNTFQGSTMRYHKILNLQVVTFLHPLVVLEEPKLLLQLLLLYISLFISTRSSLNIFWLLRQFLLIRLLVLVADLVRLQRISLIQQYLYSA